MTKHRFRVVNLTGNPLEIHDLPIRDGINFFSVLEDNELSAIQTAEKLHVEEYCHSKEKYVPYGEAVSSEEADVRDSDEQETEKEDETPDSPDDAETQATGQQSTNPDGAVNTSDNSTEAPTPLSPAAEEILALSNTDASDRIIDIDDKTLLQEIIDAPEVKAGTRSAAIRRLNFLNAG